MAENLIATRPELAALGVKTSAVTLAHTRTLDVPLPLVDLFPDRGLRRGNVIHVSHKGLLLALLAHVTKEGHWVSVVNTPQLSLLGVDELGGNIDRCTHVAVDDDAWVTAMATVLDGCSVVVAAAPPNVRQHHVRQLLARVQDREAIVLLLSMDNWSIAPFMHIDAIDQQWQGISDGEGYLQARHVTFHSYGRGAANKDRYVHVWLPNSEGEIASYEENEQSASSSSLLLDVQHLLLPGSLSSSSGSPKATEIFHEPLVVAS